MSAFSSETSAEMQLSCPDVVGLPVPKGNRSFKQIMMFKFKLDVETAGLGAKTRSLVERSSGVGL